MIDSQVVAFTFVVAALTFTPGADTMREGAGQPCNRRARPYIMLDDQGPEKPFLGHARRTGVVKGPLARCLTTTVRQVQWGLCSTTASQKSQAEGCAQRLPVGKVADTPCSAT